MIPRHHFKVFLELFTFLIQVIADDTILKMPGTETTSVFLSCRGVCRTRKHSRWQRNGFRMAIH